MEFGPVDVAAVIRQASICEQARHAENLECKRKEDGTANKADLEIERAKNRKLKETEGEGITAKEAELEKERAKNRELEEQPKVPISCTTFIPTFPQLSSVKEWKFDPNDDAVKQHDVMQGATFAWPNAAIRKNVKVAADAQDAAIAGAQDVGVGCRRRLRQRMVFWCRERG
ncbi:hypothetical protein Bbelb_318560 [Branchiostoma belcheri]|nr:hypothetical protein Bbelb_318560 [Branchiostoma belcheri]